MEALIPGLTDDMAEECLIRVPYRHIRSLGKVCRRWRQLIHSPEFHRHRRHAGFSRPLYVFTQKRPPATIVHTLYLGIDKLTLFDPDTGACRYIAPPPSTSCKWYKPRLAGLGHHIVSMDWRRRKSCVHICNLLRRKWRRGAPMPGPRRRDFVCVSDGVRRILVAGGNTYGVDSRTIHLQSVMMYDLETDEWEVLPDMIQDRVPLELLNLSSRDWTIMDWTGNRFSRPNSIHSAMALSQGNVYYYEGAQVTVKDGKTWKPFIGLPYEPWHEYKDVPNLSVYREGLVLTRMDEIYTLSLKGDRKSLSWKHHDLPKKCSGYIGEGCWLEI